MAAIRRLRSRKEREETGLFLAEGIRIVIEAVEMGAGIETLVVAPELLKPAVARDLVAAEQAKGTPCLEVSADVFASLSLKEGPQGLAAVVRQRWASLDEAGGPAVDAPAERGGDGGGDGPPPLLVALDAIADPGNLGTILRTSDAAGGLGVILLGDSTDPYDPTCVRASMGSVFTLRLVKTSLAELSAWARGRGQALVGTSGTATTACDDPSAGAFYRRPLVLVMGSEREGLATEQQDACDLVVRIPMFGRADSLNVAVATGIMLYEIRRQRAGGART